MILTVAVTTLMGIVLRYELRDVFRLIFSCLLELELLPHLVAREPSMPIYGTIASLTAIVSGDFKSF